MMSKQIVSIIIFAAVFWPIPVVFLMDLQTNWIDILAATLLALLAAYLPYNRDKN